MIDLDADRFCACSERFVESEGQAIRKARSDGQRTVLSPQDTSARLEQALEIRDRTDEQRADCGMFAGARSRSSMVMPGLMNYVASIPPGRLSGLDPRVYLALRSASCVSSTARIVVGVLTVALRR